MRLILFLGAIVTLLSGCQAVSSRMKERFAPVPPQVRTFEAERKAVYEASQVALRKMGFNVTRAAEAQGIVNGISGIRSSDVFRNSRQYVLELRIASYDPGVTSVSALLHEYNEGDVKAGPTDQILREHGIYDSYFEMLQRVLVENGTLKAE